MPDEQSYENEAENKNKTDEIFEKYTQEIINTDIYLYEQISDTEYKNLILSNNKFDSLNENNLDKLENLLDYLIQDELDDKIFKKYLLSRNFIDNNKSLLTQIH